MGFFRCLPAKPIEGQIVLKPLLYRKGNQLRYNAAKDVGSLLKLANMFPDVEIVFSTTPKDDEELIGNLVYEKYLQPIKTDTLELEYLQFRKKQHKLTESDRIELKRRLQLIRTQQELNDIWLKKELAYFDNGEISFNTPSLANLMLSKVVSVPNECFVMSGRFLGKGA